MLRQIKRWLRSIRGPRRQLPEDSDANPDLESAMRNHLISTRLVRIQAAKSAKALQRVSDVLAMKAKAMDSIKSAEEALASLDRNNRNDK